MVEAAAEKEEDKDDCEDSMTKKKTAPRVAGGNFPTRTARVAQPVIFPRVNRHLRKSKEAS